MSVSRRTVYDWKCEECGASGHESNEHVATLRDREHADFHASSKAIGATLEGAVRDETEIMVGTDVTKAAKDALAAGFGLFSFNGRVLVAARPDIRKPLCWSRDVPGLKR